MSIDFPDDGSLRIRRTVAATPERVWEAFTTPDLMHRWMWATYQSNNTAESDLRVGGRYEVYTDAPPGDFGWDADRWGFAGIYVEIVQHQRLVYTLHWDGPVGYNQTGDVVLDEVVFVDMHEYDGSTRIEMGHVGIPPDGVSARAHAEGIESMFDHLDDIVTS